VNTHVVAMRSSYARFAMFSDRNLFSRQNFVQQGMIDHLVKLRPYLISCADHRHFLLATAGLLSSPVSGDLSNLPCPHFHPSTLTFSHFRNCENGKVSTRAFKSFFMPKGRGSFNKAGKTIEQPTHFAWMFESVSGASSVCLIAHHLGKPQRRQHVADPRYAPSHGSGNFARSHLFVFRQ